jgi:hypothetical protein
MGLKPGAFQLWVKLIQCAEAHHGAGVYGAEEIPAVAPRNNLIKLLPVCCDFWRKALHHTLQRLLGISDQRFAS